MATMRQLGIDLGTSATKIAYCDNGGASKVLLLREKPYVPSLIFCPENGDMRFGREAAGVFQCDGELKKEFKLQLLSQDPAQREEAQKLVREFFRFLYREYQLAEAKKQEKIGGNMDVEIQRTVVTYPGKNACAMRAVLEQAAVDAGFPNVVAVSEEEAAITYALQCDNAKRKQFFSDNADRPLHIMLLDMGGGTTDITIFRYEVQHPEKDKSPVFYPDEQGCSFCGSEIDRLLYRFYSEFFPQPVLQTNARYIELRIKAFKETDLSDGLANEKTVLPPSFMVACADERINLDRKQFEALCADYLAQFPRLVNGAVQAAGLKGEEIDLVLLSGGHSRWYFVKNMLLDNKQVSLPTIQSHPEHIIEFGSEDTPLAAVGAAAYDPDFKPQAPVKPVEFPPVTPERIQSEGKIEGFGEWTLYTNGLLIISGSGDMPQWRHGYSDRAPWCESRQCFAIQYVQIGEGITSIGSCAFSDCTRLCAIRLPQSLRTIGYNAFRNCHSLWSIEMPSYLEEIQTEAFSNCCSLKTIRIPESVKKIGSYCFAGCRSLVSLRNFSDCTIKPTVFWCCDNLKYGVPANAVGKTTVADVTAAIMKQSSRESGRLASTEWAEDEYDLYIAGNGAVPDWNDSTPPWQRFAYKISTIYFGEGITYIGAHAFSNFGNLSEVFLPNSLKGIGEEAFSGCVELKTIAIPDGVTQIAWGAFQDCKHLEFIRLPSHLQQLGHHVFDGCTYLVRFEMPKPLWDIIWLDYQHTYGMSGLNVYAGWVYTYPAPNMDAQFLKSLPRFLKKFIISLPEYDFNLFMGFPRIVGYKYCECYLTDDGAFTIKNNMFDYKEKSTLRDWSEYSDRIETIRIGGECTHIGSFAFAGCRNLKKIEILDSQHHGNPLTIGYAAFKNCPKLESIVFSSAKRRKIVLGNNAFASCEGLKVLDLPESVEKIELFAFCGCKNLTTVSIAPNTILADSLFGGCPNLKKVIMPRKYDKDYLFGFENKFGIPRKIVSFR